VTIYLDRTLPSGSCGQPGDGPGFPIVPLFGLAPDGVFLSRTVTRSPVSSCLAISPLPREIGAVCFCGTFRRVTPPGCYPASCPRSSDFPPSFTEEGRRSPGLLGAPQVHVYFNIESDSCQKGRSHPQTALTATRHDPIFAGTTLKEMIERDIIDEEIAIKLY